MLRPNPFGYALPPLARRGTHTATGQPAPRGVDREQRRHRKRTATNDALKGKTDLHGVVRTYDAAKFPQYTIGTDGYPQSTYIDYKMLVGYGTNADRYEVPLGTAANRWHSGAVPRAASCAPAAATR